MSSFLNNFFDRAFSNHNANNDIGNLRPHELLCVRQNATVEEINTNYKKLACATHPDKNNQCSDKLFTLITNARDVLLGRSPESSNMTMDYDQQMEMVLEPFTEVLKKRNCHEIVQILNSLPKNGAEAVARGPLGPNEFSLINYMIELAGNFALENMIMAYKKALESKFVCTKCRKQMHLDEICYCPKAANKCHCNVRKCCGTKPEDFGRF